MNTIDLSLKNADLYRNCEIEEVAGRLNLITPPDQAVNIIGRNIEQMIAELFEADPQAGNKPLTLTGPMAVWAYLVVFHAVVHRFKEVRYDDGRSNSLLLAKHG